MRKNFLIYQIIFSFFILSFPSCINQDFDLDDDKLDTNVTLGGGIDLPVGDIEKISIYDELLKVYDALEVGDDGVLYVKYRGTFPVEFPEFEVPKIEPVATEKPIPGLEVSMPLALLPGDEVPLIKDTIKNVITTPVWKDEDFKFAPIEIGFSALVLDVGFKLSGIDIDPEDNTAEIIVTLLFPDAYSIDGQTKIEDTIPFREISNNNYYLLGKVKVKSYTFDANGDLTYSVVLKKGNATVLTATNPIFNFILDVEGPNPPEISYLECQLSGEKSFTGTEGGFGDLQGAFGDGDILAFRDPSLTLDLTTNLGADFKLGLDLNAGSDDKHAFLDNLLSFEKSADGSIKTESYLLTPEELKNFDSIISTPFPEKLDYTVKLIFNDQKARLLPSDQLELSADYSFKIPFDFKEISLSLKDTVADLFSEDTYEQIFSHIDDVSIVADLDLNIGGEGIELVVDAAILGSDKKKIPGLVTTSSNDNKLSIAIKGDDKEKMKKARHLELTFRLSGRGAIKASDYIKINKLRLVSSSGIHYEF